MTEKEKFQKEFNVVNDKKLKLDSRINSFSIIYSKFSHNFSFTNNLLIKINSAFSFKKLIKYFDLYLNDLEKSNNYIMIFKKINYLISSDDIEELLYELINELRKYYKLEINNREEFIIFDFNNSKYFETKKVIIDKEQKDETFLYIKDSFFDKINIDIKTDNEIISNNKEIQEFIVNNLTNLYESFKENFNIFPYKFSLDIITKFNNTGTKVEVNTQPNKCNNCLNYGCSGNPNNKFLKNEDNKEEEFDSENISSPEACNDHENLSTFDFLKNNRKINNLRTIILVYPGSVSFDMKFYEEYSIKFFSKNNDIETAKEIMKDYFSNKYDFLLIKYELTKVRDYITNNYKSDSEDNIDLIYIIQNNSDLRNNEFIKIIAGKEFINNNEVKISNINSIISLQHYLNYINK